MREKTTVGIPFPRTFSSEPQSLSLVDSNSSVAIGTPRSMAGGKYDSQYSLQTASLRNAYACSDSSSIFVRIPGSYGTATEHSALQFSADPIVRGNMRSDRRSSNPFLQFFTKSSRPQNVRASSQSPQHMASRPSLSAPRHSSAELFAPRNAESSYGPLRAPGVVISPQGSHTGPFHVAVDSATSMNDDKIRKGRLLKPMTKSKVNVAPLEAKPARFDADADLTFRDLELACNLEVTDRDGVKLRFGDLWLRQPTCVIFIRHFWCPLCMDYMRSIEEQVHPNVLKRAGLRLIIISNGSPAMIKPYQSIFRFPFEIYTDQSLAIYNAFGMTLRTSDGGPDAERGGYVEHGKVSGIAMVVRNAVKARMPILKYGGDIKQLGGEFVLGPGLRCSFASRMHNTRSHRPFADVLSAAGIDLYPGPDPPAPYKVANEDQWMRERKRDLRRMREKKGRRRGFVDRSSWSYTESLESEGTHKHSFHDVESIGVS